MAARNTTIAGPDTRHARLAEIDREIALLQAERDALVNSLKFPIISLPVEITSQIFLHCIPGDPLSPGSFYPAVVLGHVCRQWREIALAVPDLWSSWSLAIDGNISRKRLLTGLNLWLARSQTRPLSLRLHHRDGAGPDVSPQDEHWWEVATDFDVAMLPAIVPHHRRWENVELNIPLTIVHNLAKVVPVDGLPNLTHLLLGSSQEDWVAYTDDQGPITLFADAPQLRSLHLVLEAQNNLDRMDHVELPYDQLTHFTGTLFGALECLTLLAKTPLLVECVFYMGTRVPTVNVHASTLPHLKSLKLFASAPNVHPAIVLEHLTLPALDTLVLGREELAMPHVLSSFVLRSQCTIRHFSCQAMDREELVECLQAMPLLVTLELFDYDQHELVDVLRHIDYRIEEQEGTTAQLVPGLQSFAIRCHKHDRGHTAEFSYNAVLWLLEALAKRPTPLKRFRLVWITSLLPRKPNEWDVERFQEFVENGMELYVGTEKHSWIPAESA